MKRLIEGFSQGSKDTAKISVAELIRLIQFQREIEQERPADIVEVRWIEKEEEI